MRAAAQVAPLARSLALKVLADCALHGVAQHGEIPAAPTVSHALAMRLRRAKRIAALQCRRVAVAVTITGAIAS